MLLGTLEASLLGNLFTCKIKTIAPYKIGQN